MCIIHWTVHAACNCEHIHRVSYCDAFAIAKPQYSFTEKLITYIPALADLHLDRDEIHFRGYLVGHEKHLDGLTCASLETRFELPPEEDKGCPLCERNSDVVMTMQEAELAYVERMDPMEKWRLQREIGELKAERREINRLRVDVARAQEAERRLRAEQRDTDMGETDYLTRAADIDMILHGGYGGGNVLDRGAN